MREDETNLNLLAIFHYVVGGLTALFACLPMIHVAVGVAMLAGAFHGKDAPPREIGWFFIVIGLFLILCGWALAIAIIIAGCKLRASSPHLLHRGRGSGVYADAFWDRSGRSYDHCADEAVGAGVVWTTTCEFRNSHIERLRQREEQPLNVDDAIRNAESILPGVAAPEGESEPAVR